MMNSMNMGGNPMDAIKQQLMTLLMFKSTTQKSDDNSSVFMMIYSMVALSIIDAIMKAIPQLMQHVQSKFQKNIKDKVMELPIVGKNEKQKVLTSSIRFNTKVGSSQTVVGDALLDYITNLPEAKLIIYTKCTYLVNNIDPICIDAPNDVYVKLKERFVADDKDGSEQAQVLDVYSYSLDLQELRLFVNRIVNDYTRKIKNKLGDNLYYFNSISQRAFVNRDGMKEYDRMPDILTFTMKNFETNRRFINVIGKESKMIEKRVEFFKNNKRWYDTKGIPYTLGLLLSGPPGGGKTSTIKCVANEMKRHIFNVSLNSDITKTQMENLFFNEMVTVVLNGKTEHLSIPIDKRVYVFEDIDCQGSTIVFDREQIVEKRNETENTAKLEEFMEQIKKTVAAVADEKPAAVANKTNSSGGSGMLSGFGGMFGGSSISGEATELSGYGRMFGSGAADFNSGGMSAFNVNSPAQFPMGNSTSESSTTFHLEDNSSRRLKVNAPDIVPKDEKPPTVKTQANKPADNPTLESFSGDKLTLSCLLNILDGILETPGRILIMTSNYPGKLDKALIRPGRIDLICEFTRCSYEMIEDFIEMFYDIKLSDAEKEEIRTANVENIYTPAEMTKIMFENFDSYKSAIRQVKGG